MRESSKRVLRAVAFGVLLGSLATSEKARAEADVFGLGDGHRGAKVVAGEEVVNSYAPLTQDVAPGAAQLTIGNVIGGGGAFAAGDLVFIWRATGVTASEAPSGNQTKRLDLASALATTSTSANIPGLVGLYEFARVASVSGSTLTLTNPLVRGFTKGVTQVVRVPEYTDVTIPAGARITASAWQDVPGGSAGGIVIFLATGTVTNAGRIDANGRGFHGGSPVARLLDLSLACPNLDGSPINGYAEKGEGVVRSAFGQNKGGKGNVSHAGGGGNCIEGGGGGGANLGNGGRGGGSLLGLGTGGFGGVGIDYSLLDRITMGGGGGAGEQNNGQASPGGHGGGAIYIRGNALAGKGRIEANGDRAENSGILNLPLGIESDGAGGGGAGGSIVLRFVTSADCEAVAGRGGNGGDTAVVGLGVWGPGGGGGGGRVLFQAGTIDPGCAIDVSPGQPGNGGSGGAGGGGAGATQPTPSGCSCAPPFCATPTNCADPQPVCDTLSGTCKPCGGAYGSGLPLACDVANEPVCMTTGDCQPCNGDFGTGSTQACQLASAPYCFLGGARQGECGRCTTNADCAGHAGPLCNVNAGVCGTECTTDADCKPTEWCAPATADAKLVCVPKTPNGQPVPGYPPIDGQCTDANGKRTCLSSVCEEDDDLCGRRNGSPCTGIVECRSEICFSDARCGLPSGEPCTADAQCRSGACENGVCAGCDDDTDCALGQVCDTTRSLCIDGCRPGAAPGAHGGCPENQTCVVPDGGTIGTCEPAGDASSSPPPIDYGGVVEGAGCTCRAGFAPFGWSAAAVTALGFVLVLVRRRSREDGR